MTIVKWLAPERVIPNCGVASPGEPINLPDDKAKAFIEQGEAEIETVEKPKRSKAREEVSGD